MGDGNPLPLVLPSSYEAYVCAVLVGPDHPEKYKNNKITLVSGIKIQYAVCPEGWSLLTIF